MGRKWNNPVKILSSSLVMGAMLFGLVACGNSTSTNNSTTSTLSSNAQGSNTSTSHSSTAKSVNFPWGTFTLNQRIAQKIQNHQPINVVLSFQTLSSVGAPAELLAGMKDAAAKMQSKYNIPIHVQLIGPTTTDAPQQISQVQTLLQSNQIDLLGIQPVTPDAFAAVINQAMSQGVPVFSVNTDSPQSHRIAYFGVNDTATGDGIDAAQYTIDWLKKNNVNLKAAAFVTGDTTAPWAQGRMQAWLSEMKNTYPNLKVYGTPTNALSTGYDPSKTYSDVRAFLIGHPDVQFIFDTDWGGVPIAKAIQSLGLQDKVHVIAFNTDAQILSFIGKSPLIATADQNFFNQGSAFVNGSVDFLLGGVVPQPMAYLPVLMVTPDTVDQFKQQFGKEMGL